MTDRFTRDTIGWQGAATVFFLAGLLFPSIGLAEIIPAERRIDWSPGVTVGVSGGIPTTRTEWTNLVSAGADRTGVASCSALLQSLLNSCPSNQFVYVPAGRYKLGTTISLNGLKGHWTLRGAGRTNTVFVPTGAAFRLDNWNYATVRVEGAMVKGQTEFSVTSDVSASLGRNCTISSKNYGRTNVNVIGVDGSDRLIKQISQVVAVNNGTNVSIWPPLYFDHPSELEPWFQYQTGAQTEGIGFEDFMIDGSSAASANCISWFGTRNCWFKNLRISDPNGFHFNLAGNLFMEIRDSEFISTRAGANTAVILMGGDHGALIENNFSIGGSPFVECNNSSGNVVAYNYVTNAVSNDFHVGNPFDNHAPHSMMNLWEGNWGTMYQSDSYFGSSSHNTLFRNRLTGYDPIKPGLPRCVDLGRWSTYWNLVGNVLGDPRAAPPWYSVTNQYYSQTQPIIYRFGFPFPGNTSYGYNAANAIQTPATDWRFPGSNRFGGVITGPTANATTLSGNFSRVQAGDLITIQSAANTNLYYPAQTNYPRLAAAANGTSTSLTLNKPVWATNGDSVYRIGPDAYPQLQFDDARTHLIHGNYDYANKDVVWDPTKADRVIPPSLYRSTTPPWWPAGLAWPPIGSDVTGFYKGLPAHDRYYGLSNGTGDVTAPTIPGSAVAAASGATAITVFWTASSDNVGVTTYRVERSQGFGSTDYTEVGTAGGTTFADTGLSPSTVYNYRVRAADAAGNLSGYSGVASAATENAPADTAAPTIPTALLAQPGGSNQITLSWTASTDNVGVTGYRVERAPGGGATYIQVGTPAGTTFSDSGLLPGTLYTYRVRASDAAGNLSEYSGVANATTAGSLGASTNGLVAAYGFNEPEGSTVIDGSGRGNNGTISGAARVIEGKSQGALSFNGLDNVVLVNPSFSLHLTSGMTLEAWVYPTAAQSSWRAIIHREPDAYYLHASSLDGAMVPVGGAVFDGSEQHVAAPSTLPLNEWTHLASTYDGSTLRLYVNGVQVGTRVQSGSIQISSNPLRIGGNSYPNQFFQGLIDEVRIYNRALAPAEVQFNMNAPVGEAPPRPAPPRIIRISP